MYKRFVCCYLVKMSTIIFRFMDKLQKKDFLKILSASNFTVFAQFLGRYSLLLKKILRIEKNYLFNVLFTCNIWSMIWLNYLLNKIYEHTHKKKKKILITKIKIINISSFHSESKNSWYIFILSNLNSTLNRFYRSEHNWYAFRIFYFE